MHFFVYISAMMHSLIDNYYKNYSVKKQKNVSPEQLPNKNASNDYSLLYKAKILMGTSFFEIWKQAVILKSEYVL